jgi:hypothetical protein
LKEWRSKALPHYKRLMNQPPVSAIDLAGTNTRRVRRALFGLVQGALGKVVVSRAWHKVKVDWDARAARGLAEQDIVRLILDGTVISTRLDPSRWKSVRTGNAIESLNEEFGRRIETRTARPRAETVPMPCWALLAFCQIQMRKVDGRQTVSQPLEPVPLDLAA